MPLGLAILSCALAAGTCHAAAAPGTQSYAVRVSAAPGALVQLRALDVPRGWTASFCTPRVCSPFHVALALTGGSGTIQLSYARTADHAVPLRALHLRARSASARIDARRRIAP